MNSEEKGHVDPHDPHIVPGPRRHGWSKVCQDKWECCHQNLVHVIRTHFASQNQGIQN